jgi:cysteine synthase A
VSPRAATAAAAAVPYAERLEALASLVGRTPMLALRCRFRGLTTDVYVKHEVPNFTGSIKDRMALHILANAHRAGELRSGDTIAEATSGNTGIAFAALGSALGHPVKIFMPDWMSRERTLLLTSLGAELVPVSAAEGGFLGSIERAERFARDHANVFLPRQFANVVNLDAHRTSTGPEIVRQLRTAGRAPTAFVAGVGTGGTVMGVGACLREAHPGVRVHPLEPSESPTLRTGRKVGKHRIQGISDEFVPTIVKLDELDEIVDVSDGDAIVLARRLAAELGLAVGISSGANLLGALLVAERQGPGAVAVTVFPDSNKKYLSTDLVHGAADGEGLTAREVELLGFRVVSSS